MECVNDAYLDACQAIPLTAFALEIYHYNAAVDYLTSLGIDAKDLSDYSRRGVIEAVEVIGAPATYIRPTIAGPFVSVYHSIVDLV